MQDFKEHLPLQWLIEEEWMQYSIEEELKCLDILKTIIENINYLKSKNVKDLLMMPTSFSKIENVMVDIIAH